MDRQVFIISHKDEVENQIFKNIFYLLVSEKIKKINLKPSKSNIKKAAKIAELFFNSKIIDHDYKYIGVYGTGKISDHGYDGIFLKNDNMYFVETKSSFLHESSKTKYCKSYETLLKAANESIFNLESVSNKFDQLQILNMTYNLSSNVMKEVDNIIKFLDECDRNSNDGIKNKFIDFPIKNVIFNLFNNSKKFNQNVLTNTNSNNDVDFNNLNISIFINIANTKLLGDELATIYDHNRSKWVNYATDYKRK